MIDLNKIFKFYYTRIDEALDSGFNYELLVWTFNPEHFAEPYILPQAFIRKEILTLMMFTSKLHCLVIGPPGIGKTSITEFFKYIDFPFGKIHMVGGGSGSVVTPAGIRDTVINLRARIIEEYDTDDINTLREMPKAILHLEEFFRAPKFVRDILKPVMESFELVVTHSSRSSVRGTYFAPILVYADTNPPLYDHWIGKEFEHKKKQLDRVSKESAYLRRFSIIICLDKYTPQQEYIIQKFRSYFKCNPHPAIEDGTFYQKYKEFVFSRRRAKVKRVEPPDDVYSFISGIKEIEERGEILLPVVYSNFIDHVINIAEAVARIEGYKETTDECYNKAIEILSRCLCTIINPEIIKERDLDRARLELYRKAVRLGESRKREVAEKFGEYLEGYAKKTN